MIEFRRCRAGGVELAIAEAGVGNPRHLLLLHGFAGAKEDFTEWLDALAGAGWHAVVYDQRGHGDSEHPVGEDRYSFDLLAGDARSVIAALGWKRTVLLGHSMGGMVAQCLALATPWLLDALILMGTSHCCPDGLDPALVGLGQDVVRSGGMAALAAALKEFGPGPLDTPANQRLLASRPDHAASGERKLLACSGDAWIALSREIVAQADRLADLEGLTLPTLVIVGSEDKAFRRPCEAIARAVPGARLAVIDEAGHSPQVEQPQAWWTALSAFLSALQATGG